MPNPISPWYTNWDRPNARLRRENVRLRQERDELAEKVKKHEMAFNPIQQMEWLKANINFDPDLVNDLNDARIMIDALIEALWAVRQDFAAQEREECAVLCEQIADRYKHIYAGHRNQDRGFIARSCAKVIRDSFAWMNE